MGEVEDLRARVAELEATLEKAMSHGNLCPDCFTSRHHIWVCHVPSCKKQPCVLLPLHACCEHAIPMPEARIIIKDGVEYDEILEGCEGLGLDQFSDAFRRS